LLETREAEVDRHRERVLALVLRVAGASAEERQTSIGAHWHLLAPVRSDAAANSARSLDEL